MPTPHHDALRALLESAGQEGLSRFGHPLVEQKADRSFVTDADKASEVVLRDGLGLLFPGDGLIGEEGTHIEGTGGTWFIDPIDGTHAFVEGLAHWGPTAGRVVDGRIELGATLFPRMSEFFFAERGAGAFRDGARLGPLVSRAPRTQDVVFVPSRFHRWFDLDFRGKTRSLGSTTAHLCLVATGGGAGCFVSAGWQLWDVVAGLCLLSEVQGVALTLQGDELDPIADRGSPFVAGSPDAVRFLLDAMTFRPRE
ncbi:MAG: inositol monophosphatase [Proteobacteria bacterium]|nr:inositol monophosphatase [Pseudomonadota bacterium]MCP4920726.1 inositol monophosphatase [Pseudomonadota bacterium]